MTPDEREAETVARIKELRKQRAERLAKEKEGNGHDPTPLPELAWMEPAKLREEDIPEREWTVTDLIPAKQVTLFSGHGAAGKSSIALHLCIAHALGLSWLNYNPRPGPAMYIDAEDSEDEINRRIAVVRRFCDVPFDDLAELYPLSLHGKPATLATFEKGVVKPTPLYLAIKVKAATLRPQQIVIASSGNVFAGSEIDRVQVTQFVGLLNGLALSSGGSIILIAHPAKNDPGNTGYSGSTAWFNSVRSHLHLKTVHEDDEEAVNGSDMRLLEFKKNQYGPPAQALALQWKDGLFLPAPKLSMFDEAKDEQSFKDCLRAFIKENRNVSDKKKAGNYAPRMFSGRPEAAGANAVRLEKAMERLFQKAEITVSEHDRWGSQRIVFAHVTVVGDT